MRRAVVGGLLAVWLLAGCGPHTIGSAALYTPLADGAPLYLASGQEAPHLVVALAPQPWEITLLPDRRVIGAWRVGEADETGLVVDDANIFALRDGDGWLVTHYEWLLGGLLVLQHDDGSQELAQIVVMPGHPDQAVLVVYTGTDHGIFRLTRLGEGQRGL